MFDAGRPKSQYKRITMMTMDFPACISQVAFAHVAIKKIKKKASEASLTPQYRSGFASVR